MTRESGRLDTGPVNIPVVHAHGPVGREKKVLGNCLSGALLVDPISNEDIGLALTLLLRLEAKTSFLPSGESTGSRQRVIGCNLSSRSHPS